MAIARESLLPLPGLPVAAIAEAEVHSLAQLFDARVAGTPAAIACRWFCSETHSWREESWQALDARAQRYADALAGLGLAAGERVAIMLGNGPDWVAIEQAVFRQGLVAVGVYALDLPAAAALTLADSGARAGFFSDDAAWAAIAAAAPLPQLQTAVLMQGAAHSPQARSREDFLRPAQAPAARVEIGRDSLAALVYTSGTSGRAKGAMMSHGALLANVFGCARALQPGPQDLLLSLLPLSHSFERVAGWHCAVLTGAITAYARGAEHLAEDLRSQAPTRLLAVPRVFERLYARLLQTVEDGPLARRALFHLVTHGGSRSQRLPKRLTQGVCEAVRAGFGGRLRMAVSGGAPLCPELARAFAALGIPVLQGYGLTEAGPVVSVNRPGDADPDSAGQPLDNVETRVAPNGELLVRGPALMQGYWQDEAATRLALDDAGWLHTGDKVSRLASDKLYLTGRLKDLLVLSTGVKASPSEIEARLTAEPLIEQALVLGEARPYLVALLVPEPARLAALRAELGLRGPAALDDAEARARLEAAVLARCRTRLSGLSIRHHPLRLALTAPWTLANGLLTTTLKPRRAQIAKAYAAEIEALYAGHCHGGKTDCSSNAENRE